MVRPTNLFACVCLAGIAHVVASASAPAADAVAWRKSLDQAKIEAAQSNRLVLIHFYTQSCGPCRILDQEVFSMPPVAAALEQEFVPVKIDADSAPAIAAAYRIDRVPTDVILTPQGNVLNMQGCPSTGENYVGQLGALARHFKQTTLASGQTGAPATVNAAYANLPVSAVASVASTTTSPTHRQQLAARQAAAQPAAGEAGMQPLSPSAMQANPYMSGQPTATPPAQTGAVAGGQVRPAYPPAQPTLPAASPTTTSATPAADARYAGVFPSAGAPAMPANAMPNSYRGAGSNPTAPVAGAAVPNAALAAGALQAGVPNAAAAPAQAPAAAFAAQMPAAAYPTATVPAKPTPPAQPAIPAGSPPLAFDGCCPVTLKTLKRWTVGVPTYGAVHRGRTYLFVGAAERDQFLADPDGYSPVFSGMDPVKLLDEQKLAAGSRKYGFEVGGRFYLFSSPETMEKFRANFPAYSSSVRQAMNRLDAGGSDIIRR